MSKRNISCLCGNKLPPAAVHDGPGVTEKSTTQVPLLWRYPGRTGHLSCKVSSRTLAGHEGTAGSMAEGEGVGDVRCKEACYRAAVAQADASSRPLATSPVPPCLGTKVALEQGISLHSCRCLAHPRGTHHQWCSPQHLQAVPLQSCCHQAPRHSHTGLRLLCGEGRVTLSYILKAIFHLQKAAK